MLYRHHLKTSQYRLTVVIFDLLSEVLAAFSWFEKDLAADNQNAVIGLTQPPEPE
jgi:hypothetical protein